MGALLIEARFQLNRKQLVFAILILMNCNIQWNSKSSLAGGIGFAYGKPVGIEEESSSESEPLSTANDNETEIGGIFDVVDITLLRKECPEAERCPASTKYFIVCGSDGIMYKNIGVLACAQRCDRDLKLEKFGTCDGAEPMTTTTGPPISTTTLTSFFGIKVNPESQIKFNKEKDHNLVETLYRRIKNRVGEGGYTLPKEWREWCAENPDECYYGFDPSYNPALYLIPVKGYSERDKFFKYQEETRRKTIRRLSGIDQRNR